MTRTGPIEPSIADVPMQSSVASFDDACRRAWTPVVRLLMSTLPPGADVENAAAVCFEIAWRRRDEIVLEQMTPWLLGVAINVARNERRSMSRRGRLGLRIWSVTRSRSAASAEVELIGEELGLAGQVLDALRPEDREVLVLHAWEELSSPEIASILGIGENAASQRLRRARQRFADEWNRRRVRYEGDTT